MTLSIAALVSVLVALYWGTKLRQRRAFDEAHNFAYERLYNTDRGYFPDEFTGMDRLDIIAIVRHFNDVERKWWMFGKWRERCRMERRVLQILSAHIRTDHE